jgi:hypothetical protein
MKALLATDFSRTGKFTVQKYDSKNPLKTLSRAGSDAISTICKKSKYFFAAIKNRINLPRY